MDGYKEIYMDIVHSQREIVLNTMDETAVAANRIAVWRNVALGPPFLPLLLQLLQIWLCLYKCNDTHCTEFHLNVATG